MKITIEGSLSVADGVYEARHGSKSYAYIECDVTWREGRIVKVVRRLCIEAEIKDSEEEALRLVEEFTESH